MASTSNSNSSSSSVSQPVETPQNQWQLALSQFLSNLGQQQLTWANQQFNNSQAVTDANINRYIQQADAARAQGQNLWDRYTGVYQPEENALVQDANTYASTARTQQNMGLAESDVGQAEDQAKHNAEMQLQSFGIDPSSGRYAELDKAAATKRAAAQAGAGTQAALATQDTGRMLRGQAIQVGQTLPAASVNAMNAALGGIAGAENSILGQENAGANLMHTADPYFSSAMRVQNPPMSTTQSSRSTTTQNSDGNQGNGAASSRESRGVSPLVSGDGGGAGYYGGASPSDESRMRSPSGGGGGAGYYGGASPRGGGGGPGMIDWGSGGGMDGGDQTPYGGIGTQMGQNDTFDQGGIYMPPSDTSGAQFGDPSQSGYTPGGTDFTYGGGAADYGGYTPGGTDFTYGGGAADYGGDAGGGAANYGGYAGGGVVPTTGGHVSRQASPSRGVVEDDVPARLNADEYVIPRDVVHHQGTKYFDDLIKKSRAVRGAGQEPIGAQQKPALGGPPRFVSRPGVQ